LLYDAIPSLNLDAVTIVHLELLVFNFTTYVWHLRALVLDVHIWWSRPLLATMLLVNSKRCWALKVFQHLRASYRNSPLRPKIRRFSNWNPVVGVEAINAWAWLAKRRFRRRAYVFILPEFFKKFSKLQLRTLLIEHLIPTFNAARAVKACLPSIGPWHVVVELLSATTWRFCNLLVDISLRTESSIWTACILPVFVGHISLLWSRLGECRIKIVFTKYSACSIT